MAWSTSPFRKLSPCSRARPAVQRVRVRAQVQRALAAARDYDRTARPRGWSDRPARPEPTGYWSGGREQVPAGDDLGGQLAVPVVVEQDGQPVGFGLEHQPGAPLMVRDPLAG